MAAEQTSVRIGGDDDTALAAFAGALAEQLVPGDVLCLFGSLGAGKTALTRHLARALGVGDDQYVSSPSFALLHTYDGRLRIHHMDCYRLADADEVVEAGLADALETDGVAVVEWPERLGALTPADRLDLRFEIEADQSRRITLEPHGEPWQARLAELVRHLITLPSVNH